MSGASVSVTSRAGPLSLDKIYVYGPSKTSIEQINNSTGTVLYLHHDQQGSIRLLTGSTGTVVGSTTFDAYGNKTGSTGTSTTPLGYDAQYTSSDTGLVYMRARTYDPSTAQFLTRDPWVALTGEPYSYTGRMRKLRVDRWQGLRMPGRGTRVRFVCVYGQHDQVGPQGCGERPGRRILGP